MSLNLTQLSKLSNEFYRENKESIGDIILFGSILKGARKPNDVDILIVFKEKQDIQLAIQLRKKLEHVIKDLEVNITYKTKKGMKEPGFSARDAILFEGYSLINKSFISSDYGFESLGLFIYQTKGLKNTEKTKFYYALNGRRGSKGFLESINAIKLSDNLIFVPRENIGQTHDFFKFWNIENTYVPSLIPLGLARKSIIGKLDSITKKTN